MDQRPFVSVVIPVFNGSHCLVKCLGAIENQTYPKDRYEVIVVDNNSNDGIGPVIAQFGHVKTAHEQEPSSYAARNKGITGCRGEVIAFTDADCVPAQDWLERGVESLLGTPGCGMAVGNVEFRFKNSKGPSIIELYDSLTFLQQRKFVEQGRFGATANLFTFKKIFDEVGLFDGSLKSGGDVKWGNLIHERGYKQIYVENARVAHPAMDSLRKLRRKVVRVTGGHHIIYNRQSASFGGFMAQSFRDFVRNFKTVAGVFGDERLKGAKQRIQFLMVLLFHKFTGACERIRLRCGGKPRRG
jgi:glycosyltransferase involved in cell wall biosynthesis